MMKHIAGFTLVELMITLVVASILLVIGVPSFIEVMRNSRTVTATNELVTALNLARSEAVKRGMQVSVRRNGTQWETGWSVFSDVDGDGNFEDDGDATLCESGEDCQLRIYEALSSGYTLRTGAHYSNWVAYLPDGRSKGNGGSNDTFRLCADDQVTTNGRSIVVSIGGRVRTEEGAASCP
jgi:type IV fimbrial biogenesis protein FimT